MYLSRTTLNIAGSNWGRSPLKTMSEGALRKIAGAVGMGALRGANRFAGTPMPKVQKHDPSTSLDPHADYNASQRALGLSRFIPKTAAWNQSVNLRKEFADAQAKKLKDVGSGAEHAQKQREANLASQQSYDTRQSDLANARAKARRTGARKSGEAATTTADAAKTSADANKLIAQGKRSRYKAQAFATKAKAKRADLHTLKSKTPTTPTPSASAPSPLASAPAPAASAPTPSASAASAPTVITKTASPEKPKRAPLISGASVGAAKPKPPMPPAPSSELEGGWQARKSGLIVPKKT